MWEVGKNLCHELVPITFGVTYTFCVRTPSLFQLTQRWHLDPCSGNCRAPEKGRAGGLCGWGEGAVWTSVAHALYRFIYNDWNNHSNARSENVITIFNELEKCLISVRRIYYDAHSFIIRDKNIYIHIHIFIYENTYTSKKQIYPLTFSQKYIHAVI